MSAFLKDRNKVAKFKRTFTRIWILKGLMQINKIVMEVEIWHDYTGIIISYFNFNNFLLICIHQLKDSYSYNGNFDSRYHIIFSERHSWLPLSWCLHHVFGYESEKIFITGDVTSNLKYHSKSDIIL